MQLAAQNQGCDWKLFTRRAALWFKFKAHRPKQSAAPPCRDKKSKAILSRSPDIVDKSFAAAIARAQNWIDAQNTPATGFFKHEAQGIGGLPLVDAFAQQAASLRQRILTMFLRL